MKLDRKCDDCFSSMALVAKAIDETHYDNEGKVVYISWMCFFKCTFCEKGLIEIHDEVTK